MTGQDGAKPVFCFFWSTASQQREANVADVIGLARAEGGGGRREEEAKRRSRVID